MALGDRHVRAAGPRGPGWSATEVGLAPGCRVTAGAVYHGDLSVLPLRVAGSATLVAVLRDDCAPPPPAPLHHRAVRSSIPATACWPHLTGQGHAAFCTAAGSPFCAVRARVAAGSWAPPMGAERAGQGERRMARGAGRPGRLRRGCDALAMAPAARRGKPGSGTGWAVQDDDD